MTTRTIVRREIPEDVIPARRLGRHIEHDPESRRYPADTSGLDVADVEWAMHIGVMDQGDMGRCTAETATENLASEPFWPTIPTTVAGRLGDAWATDFYSDEEKLDGGAGLPTEDNGSSGLTSAKVAKGRGLISGYTHTFTALDAIKALQKTPAAWGTLWKSGMDAVDPNTGQIKYSGTTRGGHELCLYKVVAGLEQIWFRQSWGPWGYQNKGVGWISFADFEASLADQGDVTFYAPLSQPAPTPTPVPTPIPAAPVRYEFTAADAADLEAWAVAPHIWSKATRAAKAWTRGTVR